MREKVVLGLSGGVDSAVAAGLLSKEYEVYCVYLDIGLGGTGRADARAVAEGLGLPFEAVDIRAALEAEVCAPSLRTIWRAAPPALCPMQPHGEISGPFYHGGSHRRTLRRHRALRPQADGRGRPDPPPEGNARQRSVLHARASPGRCSRASCFRWVTTRRIRSGRWRGEAALPVADKPDSMEICFYP